jgi:hypothetical protein
VVAQRLASWSPADLCAAWLTRCRFVAVERGGARYPPYPISRTRSAFPSRQVLLEYEEALALATRVDAALEVCVWGWGLALELQSERGAAVGVTQLLATSASISLLRRARHCRNRPAPWMRPPCSPHWLRCMLAPTRQWCGTRHARPCPTHLHTQQQPPLSSSRSRSSSSRSLVRAAACVCHLVQQVQMTAEYQQQRQHRTAGMSKCVQKQQEWRQHEQQQ